MDGRYHIEITDRATGRRADCGGFRGSIDTSLGLLSALGGSGEAGDAFLCAVIADGDSGVAPSVLRHLIGSVFGLFQNLAEVPGAEAETVAAVAVEFARFCAAMTLEPAKVMLALATAFAHLEAEA